MAETFSFDLQLTERRRGNDYYRRGQMDQAMHHYARAKSVVDLVAGMGKSDQEEIDKNKVSVLLNIAAVHMEQGEHAAACSSCTAALALDPKNVKGLVRRAQCHIARHEQKVSGSASPQQDPIPWRRLPKVLEKPCHGLLQAHARLELLSLELLHACLDIIKLPRHGAICTDVSVHLWQDALADLEAVDELDPYNMKAAVLRKKLSKTAVQGKESESAVYTRMFDNSLQPC